MIPKLGNQYYYRQYQMLDAIIKITIVAIINKDTFIYTRPDKYYKDDQWEGTVASIVAETPPTIKATSLWKKLINSLLKSDDIAEQPA